MTALCTHKFPAWGVTLIMPQDMADADMAYIMMVTNGCGRDGIESRVVPDSIMGLDISPACRVHDWMYTAAAEEPDEEAATDAEMMADSVLAANLDGIICQKSANKFMRWLRLKAASVYIDATSCTDIVHPSLIDGVKNAPK